MARKSDGIFLTLIAVGLWMTAAWLLSKHGLELPTRHPPKVIHLEGLAQWLFAGGPTLAGVALALAAWRVHRGGMLGPDQVTPAETVCFLLGIASLVLGVLLGGRS